jgi:excisionase family DNA binding protein
MTVQDFVRETTLSRSTIERLIHAGVIPVVRVGRCRRIPEDALDALMKVQKR